MGGRHPPGPGQRAHRGAADGRSARSAELRDALAEYLARARGVRTSPESIVICAGVRHAVELLTRVVGGPIALEAYGLFIFRDAIAALGVQTIPIGLDENGEMVSDLDELD